MGFPSVLSFSSSARSFGPQTQEYKDDYKYFECRLDLYNIQVSLSPTQPTAKIPRLFVPRNNSSSTNIGSSHNASMFAPVSSSTSMRKGNTSSCRTDILVKLCDVIEQSNPVISEECSCSLHASNHTPSELRLNACDKHKGMVCIPCVCRSQEIAMHTRAHSPNIVDIYEQVIIYVHPYV